jgi:ABC-type transporter Mla subunit MlaD
MSNFEDDLPDTASLLQRAYRTYVTVHAQLMQEVDRLVTLDAPTQARARAWASRLDAATSAADEAAAGAAKNAAEVAKRTAEEARSIRDTIDRHQRALEQVLHLTARVERMQKEAGHGRDGGLDLESARREILGELARLAARG